MAIIAIKINTSGEHNLSNIRYAHDTIFMSDKKRKLQVLLDKVIKESLEKGLTIKKTNCMVISKRGSSRYKLQIGSIKFIHGNLTIWEVITRMKQIQRHVGIVNDAFKS